MLPSDIRNLHEAYQNIYEESDLLTDNLIEEIVEELVEECLEFGYTLDESADAVEAAAILYIDEATVTYGHDTISPEDRRTGAKSRLKDMKASKRKAAVKGAVERVKSTAQGVKAAAGIAGSIAKDEVMRAGRTASHAVQKKKAEVKGGIKKMIGGGLRAVAGGIGKVAQRAAGAASKFGESVELGENRAMARDPEGRKSGHSKQPDPSKAGFTGIGNMSIAQIAKMSAKIGKDKKQNEEFEQIDEISNDLVGRSVNKRIAQSGAAHNREMRDRTPENARASARAGEKEASMKTAAANRRERMAQQSNEEVEIYDVVLEYLMSEGHADTIAEAEYIMTELDSEMVNQIIETRMDPRGRPASGPMNVYGKSKPNTDPAFQAALKSVRDADAKKTPEQRKKELDAYKARQMNR
jgi:hypothetical protein